MHMKAGHTHKEFRPWGYFETLAEGEGHKVKRIVVYPGKRLSLQRHKRRSEHWLIISGKALVTLGDDETPLEQGQSVDIAKEALHRILNKGDDNLTYIEIQTGEYFGEDDIERVEDDFGRVR